jgi:ribokinase
MMNPVDVIGVGDADIDIYLDVTRIPGRDEKVLARSVHLCPGGMVANFLVALRRLGTTCGFHGPVGDDEFGRLTLADLAANEVDTSGAVVKPGERTYFCVVMLDQSGEKALVVAPTGCLFPQPDDVSEEWIARARHLHTTAAIVPTVAKAIRLAKQHGLTISMDIEPSAAGDRAELWPLLTQVDLLFVNQRALKFLCDRDSPREAAKLITSRGTGTVCVTMGQAGSLVANSAISFRAETFSVPVVDSTGAGDCFAAGFVHGFLNDWPLHQTATFASAVGALSVIQRGGHTGAPTFRQVTEFLAEHAIAWPSASESN